MEIIQINYSYLTAYMVNNIVFQLDGKTFKSVRAFKNYVGKSKDLPKTNKNEIFNISGSTQRIENVYNNLIKG